MLLCVCVRTLHVGNANTLTCWLALVCVCGWVRRADLVRDTDAMQLQPAFGGGGSSQVRRGAEEVGARATRWCKTELPRCRIKNSLQWFSRATLDGL